MLDRLDALHGELVTSVTGSYQPPMLIDPFGYLSWRTGSVEQALGEDALSHFETLHTRLHRIQEHLQSLQWEIVPSDFE